MYGCNTRNTWIQLTFTVESNIFIWSLHLGSDEFWRNWLKGRNSVIFGKIAKF